MRAASAKDLRLKTAALLDEVRRGHEVVITYRGKSVAVLAPIARARHNALSSVGFGMWKGRRDMRDVEAWLRKVRKPRVER
jgi:prevent-host-death family protein